MKNRPRCSHRPRARARALVLCALAAAAIGAPPLAAHQPGTTGAPAVESRTDAGQREVLAVRDAFSTALRAGDLATVERLLAPDALVLESGGAERSRAEYMEKHAPADAAFLAAATVDAVSARVEVVGELAWIASETRLHYTKDGTKNILASTETMVLRRTAEGWRIAHIHWSSGP